MVPLYRRRAGGAGWTHKTASQIVMTQKGNLGEDSKLEFAK